MLDIYLKGISECIEIILHVLGISTPFIVIYIVVTAIRVAWKELNGHIEDCFNGSKESKRGK